MKNTVPALVSTAVGASGVTFSLCDADHCLFARLHFSFEQWGSVCSMNGSTPAEAQFLAPTLEKHLVRLHPEKAALLAGGSTSSAPVDLFDAPFLPITETTLRAVRARILRVAYFGSPRFAGALPTTLEYTSRIHRVLVGLPDLRVLKEDVDMLLQAIVLDAFEVEGVRVPAAFYEHFRIRPLSKTKLDAMVDR